jgi:hypothetical protein
MSSQECPIRNKFYVRAIAKGLCNALFAVTVGLFALFNGHIHGA